MEVFFTIQLMTDEGAQEPAVGYKKKTPENNRDESENQWSFVHNSNLASEKQQEVKYISPITIFR